MENPFKRDFKANRIFSNRNYSKKIIKQALIAPQPYNEYRIKVFYGIGGQGKSFLKNKYLMGTLTNQFKDNKNIIICDTLDFEKNESKRIPVEGLLSIAKFLIEEGGIPLPAFVLGFSRYFQLSANNNDISSEYPYLFQIPKTIKYNTKKNFSLYYDIARTIKSSLLEAIPLIGTSLNQMSEKGTSKLIDWFNKSEVKEVLSDINDLDRFELIERLPKLLAYDIYSELNENSDLNKIPAKRIVIAIDGYETLWQDEKGKNINKDKWIRTLANFCPGVLFLIFGRDKIQWSNVDRNRELIESIEQVNLSGFDKIDAKKYLQSVPITDPKIINNILNNAQGENQKQNTKYLPLYLDIEVDSYEYIVNSGRKPNSNDFQGFSKNVEIEIIDRLLEHLPNQLRVAIKPLSLSNYVDHGIISALEGIGFPSGTISFDILDDMSIFELSDGKLYMQSFARRILYDKYKKEFPNSFLKIHNKLFELFNEELSRQKKRPLDASIVENIRYAKSHLKEIDKVKFISWAQSIHYHFERDSFFGVFSEMLDECIELNEEANGKLIPKENIATLYYQLSIKQSDSGYLKEAKTSINKSIEQFKSIPSVKNLGSVTESIDLSNPIHKEIQYELQTNKVMQEIFDLSMESIAIFSGNYKPENINPIDRFQEIQIEIKKLIDENPELGELLVKQFKAIMENVNPETINTSATIELDENTGLKLTENILKQNKNQSKLINTYFKALEYQADIYLRVSEIAKCKEVYDELEAYVTKLGYSLNSSNYSKFLAACGRFSEAEPIIFKGYLLSKKEDRRQWTAHYAQRLSVLFLSQNRYEEAFKFIHEAILISNEINDAKGALIFKHTLARVLLRENSSSNEGISILNEVEKEYSNHFHSNHYFFGILYSDFFTYWISKGRNKSKLFYDRSLSIIEKSKGKNSLESIGLTIELLSKVPLSELDEYSKETLQIVELFSTKLHDTTVKFGIYHHHLFSGMEFVLKVYNRNNEKSKVKKTTKLINEYRRLLTSKTKIRTSGLNEIYIQNLEGIYFDSLNSQSLPPINKLSISKFEMPFYPSTFFYKFKFIDNELAQDKYLLKKEDSIQIIDWDIKTIHTFNEENLKINENNVLLYLRFFTDVLKSGAGTFYVLENEEIPWRKDISIDKKLKTKIKELIKSPKVINITPDKFIVSANILYAERLFYCEFSIYYGEGKAKGFVEMEIDEEIVIHRSSAGEFIYTQGDETKIDPSFTKIDLPIRIEYMIK